jgi:hypothetical protein
VGFDLKILFMTIFGGKFKNAEKIELKVQSSKFKDEDQTA